jgi:ribosomal protein S18 acetylase RimI-like enzyme
MHISTLNTGQAEQARPKLIALLQDAAASGASIGFLAPLSREEAGRYWRGVIASMQEGSRVLLAAWRDETLIGSAQLDLCMRANGMHRAEASKVMVHTSARRQGVGRALMLALDDAARALGRTTLVLDTRKGDPSEALYTSLGWVKVGEIPRYARSPNGELHATAFYFKLLGP